MPVTDPTLIAGKSTKPVAVPPPRPPRTAEELLASLDEVVPNADGDIISHDGRCGTAAELEVNYGGQRGRTSPEGAAKYSGNSQAFVNNTLSDSPVAADVAAGRAGFYEQRPPNLAIKHQKPEHYLIMMLKATGTSNSVIAEKTGYSETWISQVTRQPWFVAELKAYMHEQGADVFQAILKDAVVPALEGVIEMATQNPSVPVDSPNKVTAPVRLKAQLEIINRFYGNSVVRVEKTEREAGDKEEIEKLEREADRLRAEREKMEKVIAIDLPEDQQSSN